MYKKGVRRTGRTKFMKIKQVEELVGISSKNIRFYEEQGLLQPRRTENGYRDYRQEDVEQLKRIKLFRKLGVPVEQIGKLFQGRISVNDCLENQEAALKREQDNIEKLCVLTHEMLAGSLSIEKLDADSAIFTYDFSGRKSIFT